MIAMHTIYTVNFVILIFQISPAASSPRLSNTEVFPRFLRTVSSDAEIVVGIVQAMKQFGWSRIAVITQSENIFTFVSVVNPLPLSNFAVNSSP